MNQAPAVLIPPTIPAAGPKGKNIVARLYYGELPLIVTFWAFFCTVEYYALLDIPFTTQDLVLNYGAQGLLYVAIPRYLFIYVLSIVVLVGQWRAANNYSGKKIWPILVKIITVAAAIHCLWSFPDAWHMAQTVLTYG